MARNKGIRLGIIISLALHGLFVILFSPFIEYDGIPLVYAWTDKISGINFTDKTPIDKFIMDDIVRYKYFVRKTLNNLSSSKITSYERKKEILKPLNKRKGYSLVYPIADNSFVGKVISTDNLLEYRVFFSKGVPLVVVVSLLPQDSAKSIYFKSYIRKRIVSVEERSLWKRVRFILLPSKQ